MRKKKVNRIARANNRKIVIGLFIGVGVLVLVLAGLVMGSFGVFDDNEAQLFDIKDECSLVMGSLIHQIRDDGECRIRCVNECNVRDMDFVGSEFAGKDNDCSSCDCWCE